jgi:hypothetical protein
MNQDTFETNFKNVFGMEPSVAYSLLSAHHWEEHSIQGAGGFIRTILAVPREEVESLPDIDEVSKLAGQAGLGIMFDKRGLWLLEEQLCTTPQT